jgi:hypothetical protein
MEPKERMARLMALAECPGHPNDAQERWPEFADQAQRLLNVIARYEVQPREFGIYFDFTAKSK